MAIHTISVLAQDNPGVLSRLAGLVSRRGYNVTSLSVGETHRPGLSRFTLVVNGDDGAVEQIVRQLDKLIEVVEVKNLSEHKFVERWMTLIKVRAPLDIRPHVLQTAEVFRCRIIDIGEDAIVLEATGDRGKVEACLEAVRPFGVIEVASSGAVALGRTGFGARKESPVAAIQL
jgi:acetolactate synthase-1/3 small subunit